MADDLAQLEAALVRAGDAGNREAARALANEILRLKQGPSVMDVPLGARREAAETPAWMAPVIGAGWQGTQWREGLKQPILSGTPAGDKQKAEVEGGTAAYKALQDEHPWLTLGGEAAAMMIASNPIAMAALGAIQYGSIGERVVRAGLNYAGGKAGEWLGKGIAALKGPASMTDEATGAAATTAQRATPHPSAQQSPGAAGARVPPAGAGAPAAPPGPGAHQNDLWSDFFAEPQSNGNKWGIPLTKAMESQSRPQQIVESVLGNLPLSSSPMLKARDKSFSSFNRAVGDQFGTQNARRLTPEVLGASQQRIGKTIEDIAGRNRIVFTETLLRDLEAVKQKAVSNIANPDERKMVLSKIENIYKSVDPASDTIPGTIYRSLQSDLGETGKNYGGTISAVMHDTRSALRDAMTRSVSKKDSTAWLKANEEYFNLQQVANAIKAEADGTLSPKKLLTQVNQAQKQAKFGGGNDLAELAQFASHHLPDKIPNSGTAERLFWQNVMSKPLTTAATLGGAAIGMDQVADQIPGQTYAALGVPYVLARSRAGAPASALARALMARGGAALGAVAAERANEGDDGDSRLLAAALRRLARTGGHTIGQREDAP